ncbi:zinc-dependent metalloprotease [bacterium SCSIO 12741]|nr:zinc-dependent metalloprotease [bacterium SCSIO 12741]
MFSRINISKLTAWLLIFFSLGWNELRAQHHEEPCGTGVAHQWRMQHDPDYKAQIEEWNSHIHQLEENGSRGAVNGIYRIPVVFHVVTHSSNILSGGGSAEYQMHTKYHDPAGNWDRIQDQLNRLNTEFQSANIQFCLAQTAPPSFEGVPGVPGSWQTFTGGGNTITSVGVTYHVDDVLSSFQSTSVPQVTSLEALVPFNQPNEYHYLDMYIVDNVVSMSGGSPYGEASYGVGYPFNDVVLKHNTVGDETATTPSGTLISGGNMGKTAVHEVGHWLLLGHVFEKDQLCNSNWAGLTGDQVAGTPPQIESYLDGIAPPNGAYVGYTCGAYGGPSPISCDASANLYFNNHMEYCEDGCKVSVNGTNSFIPGQITRMQNFIDIARPEYHSTLNRINTGIETTSCIPNYTPQLFTAEFELSTEILCEGDDITFTGMGIDHLPSGAQIVSWTFTLTDGGGNAQTLSTVGNNPVLVTLSTGGTYLAGDYTVSLTLNYDDNGTTGSVNYTHPITVVVEDCSASPLRFIKGYDYGDDITDLAIVVDWANEGYLVSGTRHLNQNEKSIVIFKINLMGEIVWNWEFEAPNGSQHARAFDIIKKNGATDNYIITGYASTGSGFYEVLAMQILDNGNGCQLSGPGAVTIPITSNDYLNTGLDMQNSVGVEIINTTDGGFAIAGGILYDYSPTDPKKQLLVKLDNNLDVEWIEEFDFTQSGDGTDYDFANSVVEITGYTTSSNPGTFEAAYFLGGSKSKRTGNMNQGISGFIVEDHQTNNRVTVGSMNAWGPSSPDYDYATDVLYDPVDNRIYQKSFTKVTHGILVAKIDPATGNIESYLESNLLKHGVEYLGLKLIHSTNHQNLVMTGHISGNPSTMMVGKTGWPVFGAVGTGLLNNFVTRKYQVSLLDAPNAGPDYPLHPDQNSGPKHFYCSPKNICRSPNGGYMHVVHGTSALGGTSFQVIKLDENLLSGCGVIETMRPNNQFSPIKSIEPISQVDNLVPGNSAVLPDQQIQNAPCSDFCFNDHVIEACDNDNDGLALFDLDWSMSNMFGSGFQYQWYTDASLSTSINGGISYQASDGTVVTLILTTPDGCTIQTTVTLSIFTAPTINPIVIQPTASGTFNLTAAELQLTNAGYIITWYLDPQLSQVITNPSNFPGTPGGVVYAHIIERNKCEIVVPVDLACGGGIWPKQSGSVEREVITDMVSDENGKHYITGYFYETFEFMGTSHTNIIGGTTFFVAKYDDCDLDWVQFNNNGNYTGGYGIDIDDQGDVYVTGFFRDAMDLGNGVNLTTPADENAFIAKYSSSGVCQWAHAVTPWAMNSRGNDIAVDPINNKVFITGYQKHKKSPHYFVAGYTTAGSSLWYVEDPQNQLSVPSEGKAIDVNRFGDVKMVGQVYGAGTLQLNGFSLTTTAPNQGMVTSFNSSGTCVGARRFNFEPQDVVCSENGMSYYVVGAHDGTGFQFAGIFQAGDMFITKFSNIVTETWARTATTNNSGANARPIANSVSIAPDGEIFVAGSYGLQLVFPNIQLVSSNLNPNSTNYFMAKYDLNGTTLWANTTAVGYVVNPGDFAKPVCISTAADYTFLAGEFKGGITFGSSTMSSTLSGDDFFIARLLDQGSSGAYQKTENQQLTIVQEEKVEESVSIRIYPNPSSGVYQLEWTGDLKGVKQAGIYDMQGKLVHSWSPKEWEDPTLTVDLTHLNSGVYQLTVISDKALLQERLILKK